MLDRSIPQYAELQRMIGELASEFATPDSRVYDLGCSTGLTLKSLDRTVDAGAPWWAWTIRRRCWKRPGATSAASTRPAACG